MKSHGWNLRHTSLSIGYLYLVVSLDEHDLRKLLVELCELCVEEILELESRLAQALLSLANE